MNTLELFYTLINNNKCYHFKISVLIISRTFPADLLEQLIYLSHTVIHAEFKNVTVWYKTNTVTLKDVKVSTSKSMYPELGASGQRFIYRNDDDSTRELQLCIRLNNTYSNTLLNSAKKIKAFTKYTEIGDKERFIYFTDEVIKSQEEVSLPFLSN